jgi:serine/threonine protein kinase
MIRGQNLLNVLVHKDFGPRYFKGKESWCRFFFRQFLSGLYKIHQADFAHLDLRIDHLIINIEKNEKGMLEPCLKFIDFGSAHQGLHLVTENYSNPYRPPEALIEHSPYDGEKADVFASAFVLLALYSLSRLSAGDSDHEQARSSHYEYFV